MNKALVVITGASEGLGKALAHLFSSKGHPLLLLARNVDTIYDFNLPNCIVSKVDVRDAGTFKLAIEKAVKVYGPVDCLINNAGIMLLSEAEQIEPLEIKQMLDTNVLGVFNGVHCVLSDMISRKMGTIINIGSIAGKKTFIYHAGYNATKFAVHALSESIREEVSKYNVRVCTIAPGIINTGLISKTTSQNAKNAFSEWKSTLPNLLNPEDVAKSAYFIYNQPQEVLIRELVITPTCQET